MLAKYFRWVLLVLCGTHPIGANVSVNSSNCFILGTNNKYYLSHKPLVNDDMDNVEINPKKTKQIIDKTNKIKGAQEVFDRSYGGLFEYNNKIDALDATCIAMPNVKNELINIKPGNLNNVANYIFCFNKKINQTHAHINNIKNGVGVDYNIKNKTQLLQVLLLQIMLNKHIIDAICKILLSFYNDVAPDLLFDKNEKFVHVNYLQLFTKIVTYFVINTSIKFLQQHKVCLDNSLLTLIFFLIKNCLDINNKNLVQNKLDESCLLLKIDETDPFGDYYFVIAQISMAMRDYVTGVKGFELLNLKGNTQFIEAKPNLLTLDNQITEIIDFYKNIWDNKLTNTFYNKRFYDFFKEKHMLPLLISSAVENFVKYNSFYMYGLNKLSYWGLKMYDNNKEFLKLELTGFASLKPLDYGDIQQPQLRDFCNKNVNHVNFAGLNLYFYNKSKLSNLNANKNNFKNKREEQLFVLLNYCNNTKQLTNKIIDKYNHIGKEIIEKAKINGVASLVDGQNFAQFAKNFNIKNTYKLEDENMELSKLLILNLISYNHIGNTLNALCNSILMQNFINQQLNNTTLNYAADKQSSIFTLYHTENHLILRFLMDDKLLLKFVQIIRDYFKQKIYPNPQDLVNRVAQELKNITYSLGYVLSQDIFCNFV